MLDNGGGGGDSHRRAHYSGCSEQPKTIQSRKPRAVAAGARRNTKTSSILAAVPILVMCFFVSRAPPRYALAATAMPSEMSSLSPSAEPTHVPSSPTHVPSSPTHVPLSPTHVPSNVSSGNATSLIPTISIAAPPLPPTAVPSFTPTIAATAAPSSAPSLAPSAPPSSPPSSGITGSAKGTFFHTLNVLMVERFNATQQSLFESQMENYTVEFGYNISAPEIVAKCSITNQDLLVGFMRREVVTLPEVKVQISGRFGGPPDVGDGNGVIGGSIDSDIHGDGRRKKRRQRKRRNTFLRQRRSNTKSVLKLTYTMTYTTRSGYDVTLYPKKFLNFVNSNLTRVVEDLHNLNLPVTGSDVVLKEQLSNPKQDPSPTIAPVGILTDVPSWMPSTLQPSNAPSNVPSNVPSTVPSEMPSSIPTNTPTQPPSNNSWMTALGVSLGFAFGVFAFVVITFLVRRSKRQKRQQEEARLILEQRRQEEEAMRKTNEEAVEEAAVAVPAATTASYSADDDAATAKKVKFSIPSGAVDTNVATTRREASQRSNDTVETVDTTIASDKSKYDNQKLELSESLKAWDSITATAAALMNASTVGASAVAATADDNATAADNGTVLHDSIDKGSNHHHHGDGNRSSAVTQQQQHHFRQQKSSSSNDDDESNDNAPVHLLARSQSSRSTLFESFYSKYSYRTLNSSQRDSFRVSSISCMDGDDDGGGDVSENDGDEEVYGNGWFLNSMTLYDGTNDELEEIRNRNMEMFRLGAEEAVMNIRWMMSVALPKAMMMGGGDIGAAAAQKEATVGEMEADCYCAANGFRIEQSRNADSVDDANTSIHKNHCLQEIINTTAVSVRGGLLRPEDGVRIIHGCASLLGLQLWKEFPDTSLIVDGMVGGKKKAAEGTVLDGDRDCRSLVEAFSRFGDVVGAAISSIDPGFGFVRFESHEAAHRALEWSVSSDIAVNNAPVRIHFLRP